MYIILENNIVYLLGLVEKKLFKDSKNEEVMGKFIGVFINITNYLKSNRLFFKLIQLLSTIKTNLNIDDIKLQMISDESIDFRKIIEKVNLEQQINIKDLKQFNISKGYEKKEQNCIADDDVWVVHNKDELIIFINSNSNNLYYYKINIREEEYLIKNTYEMIDFGNILLSDKENDDLIVNINISIKNDLIYICYLVNQKLNKK